MFMNIDLEIKSRVQNMKMTNNNLVEYIGD